MIARGEKRGLEFSDKQVSGEAVTSEHLIPQPTPGLNWRSLPIGPEEAFVLSRVDGRSSAKDIAVACGLDVVRVETILKRLHGLGALQLAPGEHNSSSRLRVSTGKIPVGAGEQAAQIRAETGKIPVSPRPEAQSYERLSQIPTAPPPPVERASARSGSHPATRISHPQPEATRAKASPIDAAQPKAGNADVFPSEQPHPKAAQEERASYNPEELDEAVDLTLEQKKQILDALHRLDHLTYYELLNVPTTAEKKDIKAAYFKIVSIFHPDKFYTRKLGSFKPKLERIFQALTAAHDTLTRKVTRGEYDEYLAARARSESLVQAGDEAASAKHAEELRRAIEQQALQQLGEHQSSIPPRVELSPPRSSSVPAHAASNFPPGASNTNISRETQYPPFDSQRPQRKPSDPKMAQATRRQQITRRLLTSSPKPRGIQEVVPEDVKRKYEDRLAQTRASHVSQYKQEAQAARDADDPIGVANALRLALGLAPNDGALRAEYEQAQREVNRRLAATFRQQAEYEMRNGQYPEAARSYENAAKQLTDDASLYERAAHCWVESHLNSTKAIDLAHLAVKLAPQFAQAKITLARALLNTNLAAEASKQLEEALRLDPSLQEARVWLERIKQLR